MSLTVLRPDARLITQNLVISAAFALEFSEPDWASICDLAVLIDLFCMYDSAVALGRGLGPTISKPSLNDTLQKSGFLRFELADDGALIESVTKAAKGHLLAYLANQSLGDDLDELLRKSLNYHATSYGLNNIPDRVGELDLGSASLKGAISSKKLFRELFEQHHKLQATTFLIRTFLYMGYQDVKGLVFVPDVVRTAVAGKIVANEDEVRKKLLSALGQRRKATSVPQPPSPERISPLAAVVFERSAKKRDIVPQMLALRTELTPLRERLGRAEQKIFYGKGAEERDSINEWDRVVSELAKRYGKEPHLISISSMLKFGSELGEVTDDAKSAKNWMGLLLGLPFKVISRLLARRPAVELHNLRKEVPASMRLRNEISRLFGSRIAP